LLHYKNADRVNSKSFTYLRKERGRRLLLLSIELENLIPSLSELEEEQEQEEDDNDDSQRT
jgi:hypothetical protein